MLIDTFRSPPLYLHYARGRLKQSLFCAAHLDSSLTRRRGACSLLQFQNGHSPGYVSYSPLQHRRTQTFGTRHALALIEDGVVSRRVGEPSRDEVISRRVGVPSRDEVVLIDRSATHFEPMGRRMKPPLLKSSRNTVTAL
eukprot:3512868-Prymnesium_polylepis.3